MSVKSRLQEIVDLVMFVISDVRLHEKGLLPFPASWAVVPTKKCLAFESKQYQA